jgi:hypothetical protein
MKTINADTINGIYNGFGLKFKQLSSKGRANESIFEFNNKIISDYSPLRFNFYTHLLDSVSGSNPTVLEKIFKVVQLFSSRYDKIQDKLQSLEYTLKNSNQPTEKIVKKLNESIDSSIFADENIRVKEADKKGGKLNQSAGGISDINELKQVLFPLKTDDNQNTQVDKNTKSLAELFNAAESDEEKRKIIARYYDDPIYSPKLEKVELADRGIFIALTYIIRAIALFLTEWSIYSGYIYTFSQVFNMYFGMYICIFLLIVFLANARKDDLFFKMIFYYINKDAEGGKGLMRIIVHFICILFLLPIPYIVKEYKGMPAPRLTILTFSEKSALLSGVDKFSLYMWILTSVVALNM